MNRALKRISLAAVSTALTLAVLEIALRFTLPDPRSFDPPTLYDPDFGWRRAGHEILQKNDLHGELRLRRETNALGYNDVDHDTTRAAGVRRVLFLGDSFTEGGYPLDASFVKIVEQALRAGGQKWECLNMGMTGFGTAQEYNLWEKVGLQFDPQIVVLMFCLDNDVADNHPSLSHIGPRPYFVRQEGKLVFQPMDVAAAEQAGQSKQKKRRPWYSAWLYRSYLWTLKRSATVQLRARLRESAAITRIMRSMGFWKAKDQNRDWEQFLAALPPEETRVWDEAYDVTADLLVQFNAQARGRGQKLMIVWIPSQIQVYEDVRRFAERYFSNFDSKALDMDRPRRILTEKLAGRAPHLDILPHLKAYKGTERLYFRHDGHFTPAGHREAGQAIAAELQRLGWN